MIPSRRPAAPRPTSCKRGLAPAILHRRTAPAGYPCQPSTRTGVLSASTHSTSPDTAYPSNSTPVPSQQGLNETVGPSRVHAPVTAPSLLQQQPSRATPGVSWSPLALGPRRRECAEDDAPRFASTTEPDACIRPTGAPGSGELRRKGPERSLVAGAALCGRRAAALSIAATAVAVTGSLTPPLCGAAVAAAATTAGAQQQGQEGGSAASGGNGGVPRRQRRAWGPVPAVKLAPGLRVSKVIRGCWQLSGRHRGDPNTDRTTGAEAMTDLAAFHRAGITTLDTADNYGPSEALIGQYTRLYPWEEPPTTVATKLSYVSAEDMDGVSRPLVEYAVRGSLARLGRQRLDLVQLQWAEPERHRKWLDVLKWLAELREQGLIGHIGLSNFSVRNMAKAAESGVGIVSNQVSYSLIDRRPQLFMQQAAASYGIRLLAYGTVAGGLLADRYYDVPAGRVRLDTASKQKYALLLRQAGGGAAAGSGSGGAAAASGSSGGGWDWMQEVLAATRAVAERHGVSSSAVATAWVLAQPQVAAAIVGARNARHVRDMQAACSITLDDTDMLDLDSVWEGVPNPPTSDVYVWERGGAW